MKIIKGIAVYTLIILGALVMLGLVLMGLMFIFPSFSLFGYNFQYISYKDVIFESFDLSDYSVNSMGSTPSKIDSNYPVVNFYINSGDYNLNLNLQTKNDKISSYVTNNYVGFVKTTGGKFQVTTTPIVSLKKMALNTVMDTTSTQTVNVLEYHLTLNQPNGAVAFRDSNAFYVSIPHKVFDKEINYNIYITGGNGNININGESQNDSFTKLNVSNISVSTKRGDISIKGIANVEDGKELKDVKLKNLNLYTEGGIVDFTHYDSVTLLEKVILNSTRADYKFKTLNANAGIEIIGTNVRFDADIVNVNHENGFVFKSTTGGLSINKLNATNVNVSGENYTYNDTTTLVGDDLEEFKAYESTIITESAIIEINELLGKYGIKNTYGDIKIGVCTNSGSVTNTHGDIEIGTSGIFNDSRNALSASSSLNLFNDYGNITVGEYRQNGLFITNSGDVNVKSLDETNKYKTEITTKNGSIEVSSKGASVYATSTGKGNINAVLYGVKETSQKKTFEEEQKTNYGFKTDKGKIRITLPSNQSSGYYVLAKGSVLGYVTASNPIVANQKTPILSVTENSPLVCLFGENVEIRPSV